MKIRPVGAELFHADGRTDRQTCDEAIDSSFSPKEMGLFAAAVRLHFSVFINEKHRISLNIGIFFICKS